MTRTLKALDDSPKLGPATAVAVPVLSLASGLERPILSPALALQEELEAMLAFRVQSADPRPLALFGLSATVGAVVVLSCASWYLIGRLIMSLV